MRRFIPVLFGLFVIVTLGVASALAASSVVKAGCPVLTRAQAQAALGNVKKIEHDREHTPGGGGGVTWLKQCTVHFRGGAVDIVFQSDNREDFAQQRRGRAELGSVKIIRGLGKGAYLHGPDPADPGRRELYVFHPTTSAQGPGGPGTGAFDVLPVAFASVPVKGLVALARAVLKHPIRPL